jgi:hypothetical protein
MVHYANISYRLGGRKLIIDPTTERFADNNETDVLFKRTCRKLWVIEENV